MWMTPGEIITSYRQAAHPKEQIKILAELNAVNPEEIKKIIGQDDAKRRPVKPKRPHPMRPWTKSEEAALVRMIGERRRLKEMSVALGRSVGSIQGKLSSMGMTRNIYKTKGKRKGER